MAVDDAGGFRRDGHVREEPGDQPRSDRRPLHGGDDRLRAVHKVVDEIARFLPNAREGLEVLCHGVDEVRSPPPRRPRLRRG